MSNMHILTLNWNGANKLMKLAPSLEKAVAQLDVPAIWWVRDNGSKDKSLDILREQYKSEYKVLEAGHNRESFAGGVNSLWKMSEAKDDDLILLLNNDVVIKNPKSLQMMVDLQRKTKADVVGCRLLFNDTNKLQHAGVIFSDRYNRLPYHFRPSEESDKNAEKDRYFQVVTAACCLVTASALAKIGGMDEGFRWAFEDVDMCLQIGKFSKVAYCGSTTIYHEESASLKKNPVNKMFLSKNVEHFRNKWTGKYEIDHEKYLKDPGYLEIK